MSQIKGSDVNKGENGNIPDFDNLVSGGVLNTMPEIDGEAASKLQYFASRSPGGCQNVNKLKEKHQKESLTDISGESGNETIFSFEEESTDLTKKTHEVKKISSKTDSRTINKTGSNIINDFPLTSDQLVQAGVSEQYFNNLVKELRMTKNLLTELLQQQDISIKDAVTWKQNRDQQMQIGHLTAENERTRRECDDLQLKLEKVHRELCVFKLILRREKEGETVHLTNEPQANIPTMKINETCNSSTSTINNSTGFNVESEKSEFGNRTNSKVDSVSNSSSLGTCRADGIREPVDIQNSEYQVVLSRNKELEDEIKRLQHEIQNHKKCLDMALDECVRIKQEKDDLTENYRSLHSSIEELKKQKDDTFIREQNKKLVNENILLKQELSSVKTDNLDYLAGIETVQNNLCREKDRNTELSKLLKEEKDKQEHVKHELGRKYADLKRQYDLMFHEKTVQQQKLQFQNEQFAPRTRPDVPSSVSASASISASGLTSLPVLSELQSMKLNYYDNQRRQPVESFCGNEGQESAALYGNGGPYICQHCFAEFTDERDFLLHFEKCIP